MRWLNFLIITKWSSISIFLVSILFPWQQVIVHLIIGTVRDIRDQGWHRRVIVVSNALVSGGVDIHFGYGRQFHERWKIVACLFCLGTRPLVGGRLRG
jgi:hypothetical protein